MRQKVQWTSGSHQSKLDSILLQFHLINDTRSVDVWELVDTRKFMKHGIFIAARIVHSQSSMCRRRWRTNFRYASKCEFFRQH